MGFTGNDKRMLHELVLTVTHMLLMLSDEVLHRWGCRQGTGN